jgi:AcrR family transcriptional regulator
MRFQPGVGRLSGDVSGERQVGTAITVGWQDRVRARLADPANEAATARALEVAHRVVEAARDLLLETGGPTFTVPDLAKRARTSLATLYSYFSGKDEVLLAVIEGVAGLSARDGDPELDSLTDPIARLRRVVQRPILHIGESGGGASLIYFREAWRLAEIFPDAVRVLTGPSSAAMRRELDNAVAAGVVVSDDTARDAMHIRLFVWALIQAMQVGWAVDHDAVALDAWEFCARALSVRKYVAADA